MLDKFYYLNNSGEKLSFGSDGIFANYNDLRDYDWEYTSNNNIITGFTRGVTEKMVPVVIVGKSEEECRSRRNKAFVIAEKDVINNKKGKLYIGDYYLNCWIYGLKNDEYLESKSYMACELQVVTDDPSWKKDTTFSFSAVYGRVNGFEYPFDFMFDYSVAESAGMRMENPSDFPTDFTMNIYGPAESPSVTIKGYTYAVNGSIVLGEVLTIDSISKTVQKIGPDRSVANWFNKRNKSRSVFQKIPAGVSLVSYTGDFAFDITVHEERSEPVWEYELDEKESLGITDSDEGDGE